MPGFKTLDTETLFQAVEKHRELILKAERHIWKNPETGYREWKTSAYMAEQFEALGYELCKAGNIPGFYADLDLGRPGPSIVVMGELDSLICEAHPDADPETHAVHACGHHAQCAALLGLAAALKEPGTTDGLCGRIRLMAVPAEELIETGFRETLRQKGDIRYFGGKVEFMYRGFLDGMDIAFMLHATGEDCDFFARRGTNGCLVKNIHFEGTAAHAGGSPHLGVNALYAATLGLQAINSLRETFQEKDFIRVHPIITKGGNAVNAIPDSVTMESYVRGASMDAIIEANQKTSRALAGAAAAMGCKLQLCDRSGYAPLQNDPTLLKYAEQAMHLTKPDGKIVVESSWGTGCTDMGDVSTVLPSIHPYVGGASGIAHGSDYQIIDPETACLSSAKCQLALLHLLLQNDGTAAKEVIANYQPVYPSFQAYFDAMDALERDIEAVSYPSGSTAQLQF